MKSITISGLLRIAFVLFLIFSCQIKCHRTGAVPYSIFSSSVAIVANVFKITNILLDSIEKKNVMMGELKALSQKSDLLRIDMEAIKDEMISRITQNAPGLVELNRRLSTVFVNSLRIDKSYNSFLRYVEDPDSFDQFILEEFALKTIAEDNNGLDYLLEEIHGLVVLNEATSLSAVNLLIEHMETFMQYTKVLKSPQQLLYDLLNSIIYTEIKGRLTIRFSYRLLKMYKQGNYGGHIKKSEHEFAIRINKTVKFFKAAMAKVSQEVWRTDPVVHIEDTTYTELKRVFQEYVTNEYDISTSDKCSFTCGDYWAPSRKRYPNENFEFRCYYSNEICAYQRVCAGYVYGCRKQIDGDMYICPSNDRSRRYKYIDYGSGQRYGLKGDTCSDKTVQVSHHFTAGFYWCNSCMCVCDDLRSDSERFFNLNPAMAQVKDNYVVTGTQLIKQDGVIHIQIQEGQLLPNGLINESTIRWAEVNNSLEFHKLQWDVSREINLDDLLPPKDHVLIGLSFASQTFARKYKRLHLKIFSAPLNFTTGIVLPAYQQEFISKSSSDEIDLRDLDIPTRTTAPTVTRSTSNQYLKFAPSGLQYDVGQSTIPFIDIQKVVTIPPMPMTGAGIYHKRRSGSGGFIALKLFTYNTEPYVQPNQSEEKSQELLSFELPKSQEIPIINLDKFAYDTSKLGINSTEIALPQIRELNSNSTSESFANIFSRNILFATLVNILFIC